MKKERRQRNIEVYLEWIRSNVPQLAFQSEEYQKQVITFAIEQTTGTRAGIAVAAGLLALLIGKKILQEIGLSGVSVWQETLIASVPAAVIACLTTFVAHILIRRRIRELAGPIV